MSFNNSPSPSNPYLHLENFLRPISYSLPQGQLIRLKPTKHDLIPQFIREVENQKGIAIKIMPLEDNLENLFDYVGTQILEQGCGNLKKTLREDRTQWQKEFFPISALDSLLYAHEHPITLFINLLWVAPPELITLIQTFYKNIKKEEYWQKLKIVTVEPFDGLPETNPPFDIGEIIK